MLLFRYESKLYLFEILYLDYLDYFNFSTVILEVQTIRGSMSSVRCHCQQQARH